MKLSELSDEQQEFIARVKAGENVLVDACIGSGKTTAIQCLCDELSDKKILYLTYNRLLKLDAKEKIVRQGVTVTNYHGFAAGLLYKEGVSVGVGDMIGKVLELKPSVPKYDLMVLDEYQDIEQELAELLWHIKEYNPDMQIAAVGDMEQKIYDKTTLDVPTFISEYLGTYTLMKFTRCFRLSKPLADSLGRVWNKEINGVNTSCKVSYMNLEESIAFLMKKEPQEVLCLGSRTGKMSYVLNELEKRLPKVYNKETVYASIADEDRNNVAPNRTDAIFTTFDSSKGLERPVCVIFDYTEEYWTSRLHKPNQSYEILRNIFCVAASRGKKEIVFIKDSKKSNLSEKSLSTPVAIKDVFSRPFEISEMFNFKYKEEVEKCFSFLAIKKIEKEDRTPIDATSHDGLIDLSPCIGIFQEAMYFEGYDLDDEIQWVQMMHEDRPPIVMKENPTLTEKVLYLTAYETYQDRYVNQVKELMLSEKGIFSLVKRLSETLSRKESVQVPCEMYFLTLLGEVVEISGRCDVLKNDTVFELKFKSELDHTDYLQCAMYMACLNMPKGILWNTRINDMYEIRINDRKKFLDQVVKTITKGVVRTFKEPDAVRLKLFKNGVAERRANKNGGRK